MPELELKARVGPLAFALQFALLDLFFRGPSAWWASPSLALGGFASAFVWWHAGSSKRRWLRAASAVLAALILVTQLGFFRYYHVFYGLDAAGAARFMWGDTKPMLLRIAPWLALGTAIVAAGWWTVLRRAPSDEDDRHRRLVPAVAVAVLALSFVFRGDGPPDASAAFALGRFLIPKKATTSAAVTAPEVHPTRPPAAVLLLLDESVRASDYCDATGPDCALAPKTASASADRVVFHEMRSVASYTALSVGALFTGRLPIEGQKAIAEAPMLFDLALALRTSEGARPTVHYLSAQTDSFFERTDLRGELDTYVTVADLVGHPVDDIDDVIELGTDRLLATRAEAVLGTLHPPFLFVAHFGGTHAPYFVDDAAAPFRPYSHSPAWSGLDQLHAAYKDAIYTQDESVARILAAFHRAAGDAPSLVLFTSDHGESFGEHSAIHHGQDLYDEQIHVPGFAVLEHDARRPILASHEKDYLTHLDVLPTILDMFGALGAFPLRAVEASFRGRSLLRPFTGSEPMLPLTNCTDIFPCPVKTYGMMQGGRALTAQPWDYGWRCVDLHDDAKALDPTSRECDALGRASHEHFPTIPCGTKNPF